MNAQKGQKVALPPPFLRLAKERDCELLWRWRNEENTRKSSFDSAYIPYEEHKNWFLNRLNSATTKILIITDKSKREIGQVRFDISQDKSAEIDISIEASQRNKGYGSAALKLACQYALEKFNIARVVAHIKEGNKPSITAFTKAGFTNLGLKNFGEHRALEMMLEREQRQSPGTGE